MQEQQVRVAHANVGGELPEAGLHMGSVVYLAWDEQAAQLFIVQWNRTRWLCSCGDGACDHKRAANGYVFTKSQKRAIPGDLTEQGG